jgi:hypothetical protein
VQSRSRFFVKCAHQRTRLLRTSQVARIEELQPLLDFETTCQLVFYEKETAPHSDPINPVASVEPSTVSVRGVKAPRSAARLDPIDIQPLTRNEY